MNINDNGMIIANGVLFCEDGVFRKTDLEISNGIITSIGTGHSADAEPSAQAARKNLDATGCYVVPGLIDIHIHGAAGADFCDESSDSIEKIARFLLNNGTTCFLGTSMSLPEERLTNIFSNARPFIGKSIQGRALLQGINMEGPFFNVEKRGAQNEKYIVNPDFDMFTRLNEACGGNIRTVAIAPEAEGGLDFIKKARSLCNVSIGHSASNYETAAAAFSAGAGSVTHIFNGMTAFTHRAPGIVGAAVDSGAYAEVICDGFHLHPSMLRAVFKLFGDDKVCLISDAMRACGMPDGKYDLGGQITTVANGSSTIEGGSLAGSVTTLIDCLRRAVEFGIKPETALKAATINPAKAVGLDGKIGSLSKGKRADILVLDKNLMIKNVVFEGTLQGR